MNTKSRTSLLASSALLCLAVLFAPASSAGETPISTRYAGTGWDTHVEGFVSDGSNVSLTTATGKGTFGDFTIAITTEFTINSSIDCPSAFPLKYSLIYSSSVITLQDGSQLFGTSDNGWICATNEGQYYGEVSGIYVGGTGRFQAATGNWVSKFDGAYFEPNLNFRSIRGTVDGMVSRN